MERKNKQGKLPPVKAGGIRPAKLMIRENKIDKIERSIRSFRDHYPWVEYAIVGCSVRTWAEQIVDNGGWCP